MPWLLWMEKAQASLSGSWVLVRTTPGPPLTLHLSLLISWVFPPTNLTIGRPSEENFSTRPLAPFTNPDETCQNYYIKKVLACSGTWTHNLSVRSQVPYPFGHTGLWRHILESCGLYCWITNNVAMKQSTEPKLKYSNVVFACYITFMNISWTVQTQNNYDVSC